jgi:hypothetical protein
MPNDILVDLLIAMALIFWTAFLITKPWGRG